jgi:hypothetical protein
MTTCPPRTLTLFITGKPALDLRPINTPRSKANFITNGDKTAFGYSTLKGIANRPGVFVWTPECDMTGAELLQLYEINETQQARLATRANNAIVSLTDRFQYVNATAAAAAGRAIAQTFSLNGITCHYCSFNVLLELPQDVDAGFDGEDLSRIHRVKLIAMEL